MKTSPGILRFPLVHRLEHGLTALAVFVLALTGLPQKYPTASLSLSLFRWLGGVEMARTIHHVAAVVLMVVLMVHVGSILYERYVLGISFPLKLTKQDFRNAVEAVRYNLGWRKEPPRQGWFTFEEKVEYWSLIWGLVIMGVTGFFLWNPLTATRWLPGQFIPAAKVAHGSEAVLAVLALLVWHTYHVHLKRFNKSMFTGYLTDEEVQEEHPLAEEDRPRPEIMPPGERRRRVRNFLVGYGLLCVVWMGGVLWFVKGEQTATVTPEPIPDIAEIEIYAPLTPTPLPQPADVEEARALYGHTWDAGIGDLLRAKCGQCHNPNLAIHHLNLTTYEGAMVGGDAGPAVVPGAPGSSLVLVWTYRDTHPISFTPLEWLAIWAWIARGAPR